MPKLNGKGPENNGSATGRGLGNCRTSKDQSTEQYHLGQGMGKRRKAGIIENRNLLKKINNKLQTDENCSTNKRKQSN